MSLSQSSEINLTDSGKQALNAQNLANSARSLAEVAQNLANGAQKTADGKNSIYRGSDPSTVQTSNLKEGDLYFTDNTLYTWNGTSWEETVSDTTGAEIGKRVDDAIAKAKSAEETADGKNKVYRVKDVNTVSTANLKVGDLCFTDNALYTWNGSTWEKTVSDTTGAEINARVDDAIAKAKSAEETADSKNKVYRVSDVSTIPTANLKAGDICFTDNAVYTWNGTAWEKTVSDTTGSEISAKVSNAMQENQKSVADLKTNIEEKVSQINSSLDMTTKDLSATKDNLSAVSSDLSETKTSLATVNSDLSTTKKSLTDSLNATNSDLSSTKADLADTKKSLETTASDLSTTKSDLADTKKNLETTANDLSATKNNLDAVNNDLSATKNSLADTKTSLATTASELEKKTGQLSGSLETANSKIEFNSKSIAEVKHTAEEVSTTVSNIRVGGRNLLTNTRTLSDVWSGATETVDGFTVVKATKIYNGGFYDPIGWYGLTNIKSNTDYVLTFYAKANKSTGIYSYLYDIGTDTAYSDGATPNTLTTDYQRYTVHFHTATMPADRTVSCLPVRLIEDGVTAWIYGVQLEEGNTATQWQPAPEDTDQAISTVSQTADSIKADLANTKGDVTSVKATANSLQTQVTDNKNNISSVQQTATKLQSDLNNAKGDISSLQQTTSGLTSRVGSAEGNISQLQETAQGLTTRVGNAEGNISSLQQTADSLTSTLSNGGVNLLNNSEGDFRPKSSVIDNWQVFNDTTVYMTQGKKYTVSANSWPSGFYFSDTHDSSNESNRIVLWLVDNGVNQIISSDTTDPRLGGTHFTWNHASGTYTLRVNSYRKDNSGYANHVQIEYGDTATPWKPSNGDISQIKQTADNITAYVKNSNGSNTLAAILSMDPNNSTIGQVVNGHVVAAINTSSDGSVKIDGKTLHISADTTIDQAVIHAANIDSVNASTINAGTLDASIVNVTNLNADNISAGTLAAEHLHVTKDTVIDNGIIGDAQISNLNADKIKAGTLDANLVTVKNLNADNITAGTLAAEHLHVTQDTVIDNGTIGDAQIKNLSASKLTAGTIDANQIKVINLDAGSITTGTLNGININGSVFTAYATVNKKDDKLSYTLDQTTTIDGGNISISSVSNDRHFNFSVNSTNLNISNRIGMSVANALSVGLPISTTESTGPTIRITTGVPGDEPTAKTIVQATSVQTPYVLVGNGGTGSSYEQGTIDAPKARTNFLQTSDAHIGPIHISYHHIRSDATICISNDSDSNFNSAGSVGLQIEAGVGLGANTIYTSTNDLYIQKGLVVNFQSFSSASKTTIHCQKIISQVANTVSSRLSVKTAITKVDYNRALMAVKNTDMYDYRYISDETNQHYVSGIIDDVHDKPEYNMDPMLINQERTARIDANLLGYHHVVLQEILKKLDKFDLQDILKRLEKLEAK